jgi:hypothetical protein
MHPYFAYFAFFAREDSEMIGRREALRRAVVLEGQVPKVPKVTEPTERASFGNFGTFGTVVAGESLSTSGLDAPATRHYLDAPEPEYEDGFDRWAKARCVWAERGWGGVRALHSDYAAWCAGPEGAEVPCHLDTFRELLGWAGFTVSGSLVHGLMLREDLRPAKPLKAEAQPTIARSQPSGVTRSFRVLRCEPVPGPVRLSECETVWDAAALIRASLIQLQAALAGDRWAAGNRTVGELVERLRLCGYHVALEVRQ